jgi:CheY-like chemotaxis protein
MNNNFKFLVIDDNEIDRLITGELLKINIANVNIKYANSGREGIEWLKKNMPPEDEHLIILLDIMMPLAGGFEFLKMIEHLDDKTKKNMQIFMLSSTLNADEYRLAEDNRYVKHLFSKPLPVQELLTYL